MSQLALGPSDSALKKRPISLFDSAILAPAIGDSFKKLNPRTLFRNPVMFVVEVVAALTTIILARDLVMGTGHILFESQIAIWLWFTVVFANFAEAVAEGRGKAQADALRKTRTETMAKKLASADAKTFVSVPGLSLKAGDFVLCDAGDLIPSDGEVIEGVASRSRAHV